MDDDLLDRRMRDWKQSEAIAREAERAATGTAESGSVRPLAQRAAQLRRIADLILASILEDVQRRQSPEVSSSLGRQESPSSRHP